MDFQHHAEMDGRRYRFNVDETRGHPVAKVTAEYFNERAGAWHPVNNWNRRELLYRAYQSGGSQ